MRRIVIFGASGSGKTTLGRWLGNRLDLRFTDLDDVYWRPGWVASPTDEFREAIGRITGGSSWIVAGNYSKARDLVWPRADILIWLDLPLLQCMWRTTGRAWRQSRSGELICNGNRQTLIALVHGRDSLLGYTLRNHWRRKRDWPRALRQVEQLGAKIVRLRSASEVVQWKASIRAHALGNER